jgi:hypothetical protein
MQARLKHFLWKVAWNILPSRGNIGRFVAASSTDSWLCPFCKCSLETLCHIFLDCQLAKFLWRSSPWPLNSSCFADKPIADWVLAILDPVTWLSIPKFEVKKFQLFAVLAMDLIWFSRNKLIHEAVTPVPDKIQLQLSSLVSRHVSAWKDAALPSLWIPPLPGSFKANFDVAVRDSFSVAAAVISDSSGDIIFAATSKLLGTDALMGEAAAALLASQLASLPAWIPSLLKGTPI